MKKNPAVRRLLAWMLAAQMVAVPVFATEVEDTQASDAEGSQVIVDSSEESTEETAATAPIVYTIPQNVTGDASVSHGSHSINAGVAMIDPTQLQVESGAALMYELNSDTLLYAYNADEKMYPASVTKVMTCLVALNNSEMDDIVTVSKQVIANRDPYGSDCALVAGEQMPMEEMLYCLMVASANDAGSAISEHIAGSEAAFVELMNQTAAELGCTNTHFANPHGLHDENHYTTARDLAKIMMAALEHEQFREIYSTKAHTVPATNMSGSRYLLSTNYMIEKTVVDHYYDERVIGGKTGFTTPAGRCLAAVSQSGNLQLLTIVLGGESTTNAYGAPIYGSFETTGDLIDYGFAHYDLSQVLSADAVLADLEVAGGENNTQAIVKESVSTVAPVELIQDHLQYDYILDDGALNAPVEAGDSLGIVRVWYQGKCIAQQEIFASMTSEVKQTDPVVNNEVVEEDRDITQVVLMVILVLLGLIVILLLISYIRSRIIRARRKKRRQARAQNTRSGKQARSNRRSR